MTGNHFKVQHRRFYFSSCGTCLFISIIFSVVMFFSAFSPPASAEGIWGMGEDGYGELGIIPADEYSTPQEIAADNGLKVSAGYSFSMFIKAPGSLWAMGRNWDGCLGLDPTLITFQYTPYQVVSSGVTAVATGDYHTLFITTGGCLWTMGDNYDGQLGDGTNIDRHSPTPVPGHSTGVTQVAAGDYFSLFIKSDGSLWVVGDNNDGQLGDGTTNDRNVPYKLINSGVTAVAAGDNHSMYLTTGGALWVMGDNSDGQLGDGQILDYPYDRLTPYQIVASGVIAIDGGDTHSLFVKSGESLWAMGNNDYGQLGDGTDDDRNTPVMIVSSGVTAVSAAEHHSLFRKSDGTLWAMGDNYYGQLGDGTTDERLSPVQVPNVKASQISAGYEHSLFVGTASNAQPGAALPARNLLLLSD